MDGIRFRFIPLVAGGVMVFYFLLIGMSVVHALIGGVGIAGILGIFLFLSYRANQGK